MIKFSKWSVGLIILFACNQSTQTTAVEQADSTANLKFAGNPIVKDIFTADPATLVYQDTLYVFAGHDEQVSEGIGFVMNDWYVLSTPDMYNWTNHGARMNVNLFKWAKGEAWASHVVEKNGKFYWYVCAEHATIPGKAVGVAVADHPLGPYQDALGQALITNDMTKQTDIFWDDIDPAVFIDDDGQSFLYWGNTVLKWAKLKDNMVELEGDIQVIDVPSFTEGPYVFKRNQKYYLSYSALFPEVIDYAMADSPAGPWTYMGRLNDEMPNSPTNHQAVVEFKGNWYFVYHNAGLENGGEFRRSVCVDELIFNEDGSIRKIEPTVKGVKQVLN